MIVLASLVSGSVVAATTTSIAVMIVARVVQGGGGAIFPLAFSIIRDELPRERVAGAIGLISAIIGVGAGFAIVIAGPIVDNLSYPLAVLDPGRDGRDRDRRDDVLDPRVADQGARARSASLAVLTLSGWLVCLLLGVSEGGDWGWTSPRVIGLFVAAVAAVRRLARDRAARASSRSSTCA